MSAVELVRFVGLSHLLQPPLTWFLAGPRGLDLRAKLTPGSRAGAAVVQNMAFASVALPTALGLVLALHARETLLPGAARALGVLLAAFWCWRLYRQLWVLGPAWPSSPVAAARLNWVLLAVFVLQGPTLALILWSGGATFEQASPRREPSSARQGSSIPARQKP